MSTTRTAPTIALICDWDQTCTVTGGGSNEEATHLGLDYITASPETVVQRYLMPGLAEILTDALDSGHAVMIGTSQPMRQVIKRALVCLLGERANEIIIACAQPEKLRYIFKVYVAGVDYLAVKNLTDKIDDELVFLIPLHTKNIQDVVVQFKRIVYDEMEKFIIENKHLAVTDIEKNWGEFVKRLDQELEVRCQAQGVDDKWQACYAKETWNASDVAHMTKLMDSLYVENIKVEESEKEIYIWQALATVFPDPSKCEKIIYVEDSQRRLNGLWKATPIAFAPTPLSCILARSDDNRHFIQALLEMGKTHVGLSLEHITELPAAEAKVLAERLKLTPARLKKYTVDVKAGIYHFFTAPSALKTLARTIVNLGEDRFMIVGEVPESVGIGKHSKVKFQTIIKLNENAQSFAVEKQGLVKIHFDRNVFLPQQSDKWQSSKQFFIARITREASLFMRYNDLDPQDVRLQFSEVQKGLRIYMSMPSLGTNLSQYRELDWATRLMIFQRTLERLERVHPVHVHFDLTLNNILYNENTQQVFICDFGHAQTPGTPPLHINTAIDPLRFSGASEDDVHFSSAYDIFSLGLSMAIFLGFKERENKILKKASSDLAVARFSGYSDADSLLESSYDELAHANMRGSYTSADELFDFTANTQVENNEVIDLLKQMLNPDPRQRPGATQCSVRLKLTSTALTSHGLKA